MCCCGSWRYYEAIALVVVGLVLAANVYLQWGIDGWYLLGAILVICGVVKLFMPCCCKEKGKAAPKKKR